MSSIVLASNRVINGMRSLSKNKSIGFQNKSIPRLKRYGQISPGRHISTVARYIPSYRPALIHTHTHTVRERQREIHRETNTHTHPPTQFNNGTSVYPAELTKFTQKKHICTLTREEREDEEEERGRRKRKKAKERGEHRELSTEWEREGQTEREKDRRRKRKERKHRHKWG